MFGSAAFHLHRSSAMAPMQRINCNALMATEPNQFQSSFTAVVLNSIVPSFVQLCCRNEFKFVWSKAKDGQRARIRIAKSQAIAGR
jgi:hypothetical protein